MEPGLKRQRTEEHLQAYLAANPDCFGEGWTLVKREFPTGAGPVDLFMQDNLGNYWAVEVKRVAMLGAVDQCIRYVESLNSSGKFGQVKGMIVALDIRPNTLKLANIRGVNTLTVDFK